MENRPEVYANFDFKDPDYISIFKYRAEKLQEIRANPYTLAALKLYYKHNIADFIEDWGLTFDPRNVERGLPAHIPFVLMPKQREWVNWVIDNWRNQQSSQSEKSRDCGMSWLSMAVGSSLCLFYDGLAVGAGSRKEEYVDNSTSPKSLFWKARMFLNGIPPEFLGGWKENKHTSHMKISFPGTNSFMGGEAGKSIGRGDRASIYFVDESAFLDNPTSIDASLSATTNCRVDISTPNGSDNPFAQKRLEGRLPLFTFHWRDDPRKDQKWYDKQVELLDPVTVAQEIDLDYNASKEGILIPSEWVQAAIDAHKKLDWDLSGLRFGAMDVADGGLDKNAFASRKSVLVDYLDDWSGRGADIFGSVEKVFGICDELKLEDFKYDADGLGAGVKGDARVINEAREKEEIRQVQAVPFRGSGKLVNEDKFVEGFDDRTNKDFFQNAKAQAWWALRARFQKTFRAVTLGREYPVEELISIDGSLKLCSRLTVELSQPTYTKNTIGKITVDKAPDGVKSPNLADSIMMLFAPYELKAVGWFSRHVNKHNR